MRGGRAVAGYTIEQKRAALELLREEKAARVARNTFRDCIERRDKLTLLQKLTSIEGIPDGTRTNLYDYQTRLLEATGFVGWVASRQVGKSGGFAMDALGESMIYKRGVRDAIPLTVFVSRNLDDDREKMRYVRDLHASLPAAVRPKIIIDNKLEIEFENGARIVCMHLPKGKGPARVRADEFAYIRDQDAVWRSAVGMIARGGNLWVVSTPAGRNSRFYDLVDPEQAEKHRHWVIMSTPWWECPDLCRDLDAWERAQVEAPGMDTEERVKAFGSVQLIEIFESTPVEDFQQEFECAFLDESSTYFPYDILLPCTDPSPQTYDSFEEFAAHKKGDVFCGYDVGRVRNTSELSVMEKLGGRLHHRVLKTYDNVPFHEQEADLKACVDVLAPVRFRIDRMGIGWNLAENLKRAYGGIIEEVNFTNEEKGRMASITRKMLERKDLSLVDDRTRIRHWYSIKRVVSPSGMFQYKPPSTEKHHADMFWADALAISGAFGGGGFRKPISLTRRSAEEAVEEHQQQRQRQRREPGGDRRQRRRPRKKAGASSIFDQEDSNEW